MKCGSMLLNRSVTLMLQKLDLVILTTRRKITRLAVFKKVCQGDDLAIPVETLLHTFIHIYLAKSTKNTKSITHKSSQR